MSYLLVAQFIFERTSLDEAQYAKTAEQKPACAERIHSFQQKEKSVQSELSI